MLETARSGRGQNQDQELHPCLPYGRQGYRNMSHDPLLSGVYASKNLDEKRSGQSDPGGPAVYGAGPWTAARTHTASTYSSTSGKHDECNNS